MIPAFRVTLLLTLLTGLIYPLAMTGIAQLLFPHQANGSRLVESGKVVGSEWIGQQFEDPRYFWPRLSATGPHPYNAGASSGSNYGPHNADLKKAMEARRVALRAADPDNPKRAPMDLVTASGSGLDPHISPEAADYQAPRVARLRGLPLAQVQALIGKHTASRQFGIFGDPGVNVLMLNRDLDRASKRN